MKEEGRSQPPPRGEIQGEGKCSRSNISDSQLSRLSRLYAVSRNFQE